ncbi:MAG: histidinol-phosphatase HisJ family protein [Abditibacteriota bacterium]|nr:histidinol-phosphatase HisJ family protein [Abditibacteriota bacterium]
MYYFVDYHCHTLTSGDNSQTMEELVSSAAERGVRELCITEHFNFMPGTYCFGRFSYRDHDDRRRRLASLFPDVRILLGLEMDYMPEFMPLIRQIGRDMPLDYYIGSCHMSNGKHVFSDDFFAGRSGEEAYNEYFQTVSGCVRQKTFDTIAHFDWVKRKGCEHWGPFDMAPYRDVIADILSDMIALDMTMEVSEAGLRHPAGETYPSYDILRLYRDLGGENITYASDSHSPQQTSAHNGEVYGALEQMGFRWITTFSGRQKTRRPITV